MKKITSLVLALMMTLSVAACGSKDETPDNGGSTPAEIPVDSGSEEGLTGSITVQAEEGWKGYYEDAVARFKENNPDANVELKITGAFDNLDVLDATDPGNEDVPDVFAIPADRLYGLNDNEAIAPIDAKMIADKVGGFDNYDAGLGGAMMIDGDYLAFPMNIETLIAYANTANAEAAGIDLTKSVELNDAGLNVLIPSFDAWFAIGVLNSSDIDMLKMNDDGTFSSDFTAEWADLPADKQATVEAVYNYWKTVQDANAPMWDAEAAWGYMDEQFTTGGNGVLRISGPWDAGTFSEQAADGEDLEVLPLGSITAAGKELKHWKGGWGLAVNSRLEGDEEKVALAHAFIAELMNPEFAVDFFKGTGKIMENVTAQTYMDSDLKDSDKVIIENVFASYADAPARPLFTEYGKVWDTWKNAVLSWSSVKPADAEAAYKELKAAFDAMMLNF